MHAALLAIGAKRDQLRSTHIYYIIDQSCVLIVQKSEEVVALVIIVGDLTHRDHSLQYSCRVVPNLGPVHAAWTSEAAGSPYH